MSESHFSRSFKAAFGTSPIDWLRRERINQAKRRLVETADAIKELHRGASLTDIFVAHVGIPLASDAQA